MGDNHRCQLTTTNLTVEHARMVLGESAIRRPDTDDHPPRADAAAPDWWPAFQRAADRTAARRRLARDWRRVRRTLICRQLGATGLLFAAGGMAATIAAHLVFGAVAYLVLVVTAATMGVWTANTADRACWINPARLPDHAIPEGDQAVEAHLAPMVGEALLHLRLSRGMVDEAVDLATRLHAVSCRRDAVNQAIKAGTITPLDARQRHDDLDQAAGSIVPRVLALSDRATRAVAAIPTPHEQERHP
jgi:hypothetical protein